jgi:hypothetical protein
MSEEIWTIRQTRDGETYIKKTTKSELRDDLAELTTGARDHIDTSKIEQKQSDSYSVDGTVYNVDGETWKIIRGEEAELGFKQIAEDIDLG